MLDSAMIGSVDCAYNAAVEEKNKESDLAFGGRDLVLIGDLMQLAPVAKYRSHLVRPLYHDCVIESLSRESAKFNSNPMLLHGVKLFRRFKKIELSQQMRSDDPIHTKIIEKFRDPQCRKPITPEVIQRLSKFKLTRKDLASRRDTGQPSPWRLVGWLCWSWPWFDHHPHTGSPPQTLNTQS